MAKYILELEDEMVNGLYKAKNFNTLVFDENGLKKLQKYEEVSDRYEEGMNDAWDSARKINLDERDGGISIKELHNIFEDKPISKIFRDYTCQEVKAKIEKYESEKNKIHVGDEVHISSWLNRGNEKGIVLRLLDDGSRASLVCEGNNETDIYYTGNLTKTGRHVDLTKLWGDTE